MVEPAFAAYLNTARRQKRRVARIIDEPLGGQVGVVYSYVPTIRGGLAPYDLALDGGALPDGLSIVDAAVEGTPTDAGAFTAWLKVTDANLVSASKAVSFGIAAA